MTTAPDYATYLYWFFALNTINAGSRDAEDQILARFAHHHWHF